MFYGCGRVERSGMIHSVIDFRNIGKALRMLRIQRVKKQREIAAAAGITPAMLSAYETGKHRPSLDTAERVLQALKCDVVDLTHALQEIKRQEAQEQEANSGAAALSSFVEGNIGSVRLDLEEREILGSLLPGVLNLIRYLKR